MKVFIEWFKASTKVKRWILLILVGVVLTCYGMVRILFEEQLNILDLIKITIIFVLGFVAIITSAVFIQKRSLELIIEANNISGETGKKAKSNIKSLIFNRKIYEEGPKVVIIGGGDGFNSVIEGFKKYTNNITAIVTMSDFSSGDSSSGRKTSYLPIEDIKESIIAMSDKEDIMRNLMSLNFKNERLKGINFGDIYLSAMNELYSNIPEAILKSTEVLNISGKVIPVTLDELSICAELTDGTTIKQKDKIPETTINKKSRISKIFITPTNAKPSPGVVEAILDAEVIIIAPGSLYTNVLPNLLIRNIGKAIKESKATRYYISNIMTQPGQTDDYDLTEHIRALEEHIGTGLIDYCLADTGEVVPEYIRKYNKEGSDLVRIDSRKLSGTNVKVIQRNLSCVKNGKIRHDSDAIASTIIEMVCNDLKFHDMQNDTEYLLLKAVLKEQKKIQARNEKRLVKVDKKRFGLAKREKEEISISKFKEKYKERVSSIKNTDAKIIENKKIAEQIEQMERRRRANIEGDALKRESARRGNRGKRNR